MPTSIPAKFHTFFWDVDAKKLNPSEHPFVVTERLLEWGDLDALSWLKETYGLDYLQNVVKSSKVLSRKSANFYSKIFNINPQEILCLQEEFQSKHRAIWPH